MKKFYVIITLILWGCAQTLNAQNMYRNYESTSGVQKPKTAVSVVHNNGYAYFFQADKGGRLSVTEINPLNMLPTGNAKFFVINQTNRIVYLNGGFEDASGYFVLFGYMLEVANIFYPQYPTFIRIKQDLSSCDVYYDPLSNGEFTAGCDGYDLNTGEVYMFVNSRDLVTVNQASPASFHRLTLDPVLNTNDYFTDVSWDGVHAKFIATGSAWNTQAGHECPFVEVFELHNDTMIIPVAEYYIDKQPFPYSNEYKSLHVQLDNYNLIVYHDLCRREGQYNQYEYDNIWLTRINNFWDFNTASVVESTCFELPNVKLMAKDMIYDSYNKRLSFLGAFCFNKKVQILAQVDPYILSNGINIGQLGIGFNVNNIIFNPQYPQILLYENDFEMFNLALDTYNPCYPVLIAGVDQHISKSILTETYNIANSLCDVPLWKKQNAAHPVLKAYSLNTSHQQNATFIPTTTNPDIINMTYLCDESNACSHQFGGKSLKQTLTDILSMAEVTIRTDGLFVCDGFDGDIMYSLYDMAGKLIQQGVTRNGERNKVIKTNGMYILQAIDKSGNRVIKKLVLL